MTDDPTPIPGSAPGGASPTPDGTTSPDPTDPGANPRVADSGEAGAPPEDDAGTAPPDDAGRRPTAASGRRRRLVIGGVAAAVVLVLVCCGGLVALATGISRAVRHSEHVAQAQRRAESACQELERRLNRLIPPGATSGPRQRAAAIRNENVAVRPFLAEIGQPHRRRDDEDDDHRRESRVDLWRRLVDARAAYADALDRQANGGEPAFFIAPVDRRGRPVADRLQRGPESCAAAARRLAAPDL